MEVNIYINIHKYIIYIDPIFILILLAAILNHRLSCDSPQVCDAWFIYNFNSKICTMASDLGCLVTYLTIWLCIYQNQLSTTNSLLDMMILVRYICTTNLSFNLEGQGHILFPMVIMWV